MFTINLNEDVIVRLQIVEVTVCVMWHNKCSCKYIASNLCVVQEPENGLKKSTIDYSVLILTTTTILI